ncbi:MAG: ATP synthase F0 subunit C [Deltaproteobacteria bacterium]|nr:ATP synthase F0 subunit C [Deltaproteobacteria bacterium]
MIRKGMLWTALAVLLLTVFAPAAFAATEAEGAGGSWKMGLGVGAGLSIGLAALGGGIGQGRTAGSALDGISRNPGASGKMFVPMILGLVLIESLVIYALLISFQLVGALG